MNNKAQIGVGMLVIVAITIIVGAIFLQVIAQEVGTSTSTVDIANVSFTSATVGNSVYLTNYKAVSGVVMYNSTGSLIPAGNYTVTNNIVDPTTGGLSVRVATAAVNSHAGDDWEISGTSQATDYISDSGGRAVAGMIVIFFALAVAVVAISPVVQSKFLEAMGR